MTASHVHRAAAHQQFPQLVHQHRNKHHTSHNYKQHARAQACKVLVGPCVFAQGIVSLSGSFWRVAQPAARYEFQAKWAARVHAVWPHVQAAARNQLHVPCNILPKQGSVWHLVQGRFPIVYLHDCFVLPPPARQQHNATANACKLQQGAPPSALISEAPSTHINYK